MRILLLLFSLMGALYGNGHLEMRTLPCPYTYFENLHFDTQSSTFYGPGTQEELNTAYAPNYGRGCCFKPWDLALSKKKARVLPGTTLFLFEVKETQICLSHFFHLLEHVAGIWSFYGDHSSEDVQLIVLVSDGKYDVSNWRGPNAINEHLLKALFPRAKVKTWGEFTREYRNDLLVMERAMTSDRGLTFAKVECTKINKMLGAALPDLSKEALDSLAQKVQAYAQTKHQGSDTLRLTYVKRPMPRALDTRLENRLIAEILKIPGVSLKVVDFAKISFQEQINIVGNTDVLIGVHGNGLSHLLFLPEHAAVIEIFSADSQCLDYRLFSEARRLDYLGIISNRGVIEHTQAYEMGNFGNPNTPIYQLDFAPILAFILHVKSLSKAEM